MLKSWDLFDTLVAGRDTRIAAGNQPGVYPIAENVQAVQPDDLIISDYEDRQPAHGNRTGFDVANERLLMCGLRNRLFVSGGGKWEGTIWDKITPRPQHHTGDNQRADVDSPKAHGIKATLSTVHKMTEAEQFIYNAGLEPLAHLCRETRLRTFGKYRGIEIMQADYNFPVLFCASVLLNRRHPSGTLLMSGRDCFMWQKLMQKLFNRGEYWQTSCYARMNADVNYHRYIKSFGPDPVLVDLCGSGNSFSFLPQYPTLLMFTPAKSKWNCPALIRGADVFRLEQANRAPHFKCMGVDADLNPIFIDKGVDIKNEPHIRAQCETFCQAMFLMQQYDMSKVMGQTDAKLLQVMNYLLPHYIDFKDAVEALRLIDIKEDAP